VIAERRPLIAANWKMNKTVAEAEDFLAQLLGEVDGLGAEVVVCPPATALAAAIAATRESEVEIAAQTMHFEAGGAYTGEISAPMLIELGAWGVILGHSERRQYFCETDEALAKKLPAALAAVEGARLAGDETAGALASGDDAVAGQRLVRAHDGVRVDRQLLRQLSHRRQTVTAAELAACHGVLHAVGDLLEERNR